MEQDQARGSEQVGAPATDAVTIEDRSRWPLTGSYDGQFTANNNVPEQASAVSYMQEGVLDEGIAYPPQIPRTEHHPPVATKSSQYRGVYRRKRGGRWEASIVIDGKNCRLGLHETEEAAAHAYDLVAIKRWGREEAANKVNFHLETYDLRVLDHYTLTQVVEHVRGATARGRKAARLPFDIPSIGPAETPSDNPSGAAAPRLPSLLSFRRTTRAGPPLVPTQPPPSFLTLLRAEDTAAAVLAGGMEPHSKRPRLNEPAECSPGSGGLTAAQEGPSNRRAGQDRSLEDEAVMPRDMQGHHWPDMTGPRDSQAAEPREINEAAFRDPERVPCVRSSQYRGVSTHKQSGKWVAQIKAAGKQIYLGFYPNQESAAEAYDQATINVQGHKAETNFPQAHYAHRWEHLRSISLDTLVNELKVAARGRETRNTKAPQSQYRGVAPDKSRKWRAQITTGNKHTVYLGLYPTELQAAQAYDRAALAKRGTAKAKTNFPVENYAIELDQLTSVPFSEVVKQLRASAQPPEQDQEIEHGEASPDEAPPPSPQSLDQDARAQAARAARINARKRARDGDGAHNPMPPHPSENPRNYAKDGADGPIPMLPHSSENPRNYAKYGAGAQNPMLRQPSEIAQNYAKYGAGAQNPMLRQPWENAQSYAKDGASAQSPMLRQPSENADVAVAAQTRMDMGNTEAGGHTGMNLGITGTQPRMDMGTMEAGRDTGMNLGNMGTQPRSQPRMDMGSTEAGGHTRMNLVNTGTGAQHFVQMCEGGMRGDRGMGMHPGMNMASMGMNAEVGMDTRDTGTSGRASVSNIMQELANPATPSGGVNMSNMPSMPNRMSAHPGLDMANMGMGVYSGMNMQNMGMASRPAANMPDMGQEGGGGRGMVSVVPQGFHGAQGMPALHGMIPVQMGVLMQGFGQGLAQAGGIGYGVGEGSNVLAATSVEATPFDEVAKKLRAGGDVADLVPHEQGVANPTRFIHHEQQGMYPSGPGLGVPHHLAGSYRAADGQLQGSYRPADGQLQGSYRAADGTPTYVSPAPQEPLLYRASMPSHGQHMGPPMPAQAMIMDPGMPHISYFPQQPQTGHPYAALEPGLTAGVAGHRGAPAGYTPMGHMPSALTPGGQNEPGLIAGVAGHRGAPVAYAPMGHMPSALTPGGQNEPELIAGVPSRPGAPVGYTRMGHMPSALPSGGQTAPAQVSDDRGLYEEVRGGYIHTASHGPHMSAAQDAAVAALPAGFENQEGDRGNLGQITQHEPSMELANQDPARGPTYQLSQPGSVKPSPLNDAAHDLPHLSVAPAGSIVERPSELAPGYAQNPGATPSAAPSPHQDTISGFAQNLLPDEETPSAFAHDPISLMARTALPTQDTASGFPHCHPVPPGSALEPPHELESGFAQEQRPATERTGLHDTGSEFGEDHGSALDLTPVLNLDTEESVFAQQPGALTAMIGLPNQDTDPLFAEHNGGCTARMPVPDEDLPFVSVQQASGGNES